MKNQSKNRSKINENEARLGSKIDAKLIKNRSKNRSKIRCDLGSIFDGSWVDFGVDLGAKLGPSWDQNRSKIEVEKSMQLNVKILSQNDAKMKISIESRWLVRGRRGV